MQRDTVEPVRLILSPAQLALEAEVSPQLSMSFGGGYSLCVYTDGMALLVYLLARSGNEYNILC